MEFRHEMNRKNESMPAISAMRRRHVQEKMGRDADEILRDLAFVLKMTEMVKRDMGVVEAKESYETMELATV